MDDEPMITLQVRLSQSLLARIDGYRRRSLMRPNRSQAIRFLLENAISLLEDTKDAGNPDTK